MWKQSHELVLACQWHSALGLLISQNSEKIDLNSCEGEIVPQSLAIFNDRPNQHLSAHFQTRRKEHFQHEKRFGVNQQNLQEMSKV